VNHRQKGILFRKLRALFAGELRGKRIAIWGLAFKPRTDDIRESPALQLIDVLLSEGAEVRAHDPWAMENVRALYGEKITLTKDGYEAAAGADALALVTEWRQYQNPDFARLKSTMREPRVVDGRNIWSSYGLRKLGFVYEGIGTRGS
jgi:UDPglucose 6-dehydrogenase